MHRRVAVAVALVFLASCNPSAPGPSSGPVSHTSKASGGGPAAPEGARWFTYHRDAARSGVAARGPSARRVAVAWRARLDGAVYGQPLVVGDRVIAATENDSVYALASADGRILWRTHVGSPVPGSDLPCGNIDPLGITGTPVYDPRTRRIFAVAETTGYRHVLVGLDVATGKVEVRRVVPTPDGHPRYDQQRTALLLLHRRVYFGFGGLFGDCGPYVGSVVGVPASGRGAIFSYRVPTTARAGIWATGGPTAGSGGSIYVAIGNGAATSAPYDGSDSIVALSPGLEPRAFFAPRTWAADNASDLDLGSMSPAVLAGGRVLAVGKRGVAYLLRAPRLGGIGGELTQRSLCPAFGGPAHRGNVVYVPCLQGGLAAVSVARDRIEVLWRGPAGAAGSPAVGGDTVWVADWNTGDVFGLDRANGRVVGRVALGEPLPHFASPTLTAELVLIGTLDGVVALRG